MKTRHVDNFATYTGLYGIALVFESATKGSIVTIQYRTQMSPLNLTDEIDCFKQRLTPANVAEAE
jgi:hypothetical protein